MGDDVPFFSPRKFEYLQVVGLLSVYFTYMHCVEPSDSQQMRQAAGQTLVEQKLCHAALTSIDWSSKLAAANSKA